MDLPNSSFQFQPMDGSSEESCGGMTEEVRVLSLFSHDGADDEDDYFLCAKKAEAEEL